MKQNSRLEYYISQETMTMIRKIFYLTFLSLLFLQCTSVKEHNEHLNDLISENNLKSDVDFTYENLKQLHPKLYWYISKEELDYKFDSLKNTIKRPITSYEFYKKLSPVVASVRQGHLTLTPSTKKLSKSEQKTLKDKGTGPFSQFEFEIVNNRMYVIKNRSDEQSIVPGAEVIAINGVKTSELIAEYNNFFTSDGYNTTFKRKRISNMFPTFYANENGVQDNLFFSFQQNDSISIICIKRKKASPKRNKNNAVKMSMIAPNEKQIVSNKDKRTYGYNEITKKNNRDLKFFEKDSSIALLKIRHFALGNPYRFYKESFNRMRSNKTKTLIIDLRNNPGGSIREIENLYSYLADSTYIFIDPFQVVSKTSLIKKPLYNKSSLLVKTLATPFYTPYMYFKVHKNADGNYYMSNSESKPKSINKNAFKGKIYVMINGGTFSASSILSSNLKGSKRATFVGEETGGAYNGTVAGLMPTINLPHSNIKLTTGLMLVAPYYKTTVEGRGIFPDKEIVPTLDDFIRGEDLELSWIMEDIKKNSQIPYKNKKDKKITLN